MTVLVCPVCQGSMKEMNKSGVMIDTCTQCRGVWLDRGELEKLASAVGGSRAAGCLPNVMGHGAEMATMTTTAAMGRVSRSGAGSRS